MFQFIVDKVQKKLNANDARLLSLAGRTMLAKFVLLTICGYFIQTIMILVCVCDQIEQIVWRFVWGSTNNKPKVALVKWDSCCKTFSKVGIGLQRLISQNTTYLMKLAFLLVTKVDALWVHVLHLKYKVLETCPPRIDRTSCSYVWRSLSNIWNQAQDRIKWSVGNGTKC